MEEIKNRLKEHILEVMERGENAHPQEIAILPELIKSLHEITQQEEVSEMENYEIITHEKMYINQEAPLVTVSFQLTYYDWLLIEETNEWSQIEKLLGELRKKRSQKSTQGRENQKRRRCR